MLFTFISSYSPINSLVSFLFVFIKAIIFVVIPLLFFILEKNNIELKKVSGIYTSYFIINLFITMLTSISIVNSIIPSVWKFLFDLVNLVILLSSLLILIEQILEYSEVKSEVYTNTIMRIVYLVGNFISYPFLLFVNRKRSDDE